MALAILLVFVSCLGPSYPLTRNPEALTSLPVRISTGVVSEPLRKVVAEFTEILPIHVPLMTVPRADIIGKADGIAKFFNQLDYTTGRAVGHWQDSVLDLLALIRLDRRDVKFLTKSRRGLAALGSVFSWCCDVITQQEIAPVHEDLANFRKSMSELASAQSVLEGNLEATVHTFKNFSGEVATKYNSLQADINSMRQSFRTQQVNESQSVRYLSYMSGLTMMMTNILAQEINLHFILSECRKHHLSYLLIGPDALNDTLVTLLKRPAYSRFVLAVDNLDILYEAQLATCRLFDDHIKVYLKVPLRHKEASWAMTKFTPVPFAWNGSICRLFHGHRDILLATSAEHTVPLVGTDREFCLGNPICQVPRLDESLVAEGACLRSLVNARVVSDTLRHCPYHCEPAATVRVVRVAHNQFILASTLPGRFTIRCGRQETRHDFPGYGAFRAFVPGECTLSVNDTVMVHARHLGPNALKGQPAGAEFVVPAAWSTRLQIELDSIRTLDESPKFTNDLDLLNESWPLHTPVFSPISPLPTVHIQPLATKPFKSYSFFPGEDVTLLAVVITLAILTIVNMAVLGLFYCQGRPRGAASPVLVVGAQAAPSPAVQPGPSLGGDSIRAGVTYEAPPSEQLRGAIGLRALPAPPQGALVRRHLENY